MQFTDLVKTRRSCRSFQPFSIYEEQLSAVLDAGRWAPSPLNLQPWEFIIVKDPQIKAQVRKVAEEAKQEIIDKNGPGWASRYGVGSLEEAALLVVVVVNPSRGGFGNYFGQKYGAIQAASACIQNMLLACTDMGLGALWFTFFRPEKLRPVLNIPEKLEIAGIILIGRPKEPTKSPPRNDPIIHENRYNMARSEQSGFEGR